MKKIILGITLILVSINLFSQADNASLETYLKNLSSNTNVFDGTIESVEFFATDKLGNKLSNNSAKWENGAGYFYNEDGSDAKCYSLAKIKISKVFKGSDLLNQVYAYVLTSAPSLQVFLNSKGSDTLVNQMNFNSAHDDNIVIMPQMKNFKLIFFSNKNTNNQFTLKDNNSVIYYNALFDNTLSNNNDAHKQEYASSTFKRFYSENELKNFLSTINGVNINVKSKTEILEKKSVVEKATGLETSNNNFNYQDNVNNFNNRLIILNQIKNKGNINEKSPLSNDLIVNIQNGRLVGTTAIPAYEFDVYVSSYNNSTYFQNLLTRIQYNTSVFGSNIVANNKLTITRGPLFNTTTYIDPQASVTDNTSSVINFASGDDFGQSSWNRVQITTTPKLLCTVKIIIQNCNQNSDISFIDEAFTGGFSYYTPTATSNFAASLNYDNTTYLGNINYQPCDPIINNFNNNVPAGVNQLLTITGKNFGSNKNTGTVIFKNADKGTTYPAQVGPNKGGVQQYDVLKWTHDTIIVKIPGTIDSTIADRLVPGTGKFLVYNKFNKFSESSTVLTIPYAVTQYPDGGILSAYRKVSLKLASLSNNGYKVQINQNIINAFPTAKATIKKAMKNWTCVTGVNWFLGNDTTLAPSNSNFCIIDTGVFSPLMKTISTVRQCVSGSGLPVYYLKSFNIKIKAVPSSGVWETDTLGNIANGEYDFYSAISHEFGHAHGVAHINDSIGDLMWWTRYPFGTALNDRMLVKNSPMARTAAEFVADSLIGNLTCVANHFTVTATNCQDAISVKELYGKVFDIGVSPNPSSINETVNIKFNFSSTENVTINMFDITGKEVYLSGQVKIRDEVYQLKTDQIQQGIYLLQITVNNVKQSYKLIKQ